VDQFLALNNYFQQLKGTGNWLPETRLQMAFQKGFWNLNFKSCNRLPDVCNRLPVTKLLKFKLKSHDPSKYNCVIDYQKPVIDYEWENFRKTIWKNSSLQTILKRHDGPIYMCVWLQKVKERDFSKIT